MKHTKKVAISGIFTALCVIFLFIGSLFQTLDLSAAAIAGIVITFALTELGKGWAFGIYCAASLLSLILLPYKTAAAVFAFFCGFYPIIKVFLNNIKPMWLSYCGRIVCFNICLTLLVILSSKLFGIDEELFRLGWALYLLANVTFILFDFALERITVYYINRIRPKLFGKR